jgi:hypothetical protein
MVHVDIPRAHRVDQVPGSRMGWRLWLVILQKRTEKLVYLFWEQDTVYWRILDHLSTKLEHLRFRTGSVLNLQVELMETHASQSLLVLLQVLHPADGEQIAETSVGILIPNHVVRVAVGAEARSRRVGCCQRPGIQILKVNILEHGTALTSLQEYHEFIVHFIVIHELHGLVQLVCVDHSVRKHQMARGTMIRKVEEDLAADIRLQHSLGGVGHRGVD